jgi:hypothetical protein
VQRSEERPDVHYVLAAKESVMRYFFDIHFRGETHLDEHGEEFRSADEARAYVIECAHICMGEGSAVDRAWMRQGIVEITDREGLSDVVMLADFLYSRRNPRGEQAVQQFGIGVEVHGTPRRSGAER